MSPNKCRAHHHIVRKCRGCNTHLRRQRVDVLTVDPHIGILRRPLRYHLVLRTAACARSRLTSSPTSRTCASEPAGSNAKSAILRSPHPDPRENRLLDSHPVWESAVHPAADLAVLALDVLPDYDEVDVALRPAADFRPP